jgi:hypothetical protein
MSAKKRKASRSRTKTKKSRAVATKVKAKSKAKSAAKSAAKTKTSTKRKAAPKRAAAKATPIVRRRDATGHLDPRYANELRALGGHDRDDESAFVRRPRSKDDLAEELGEEFVLTATTGEDEGEEVANQSVPEELGGPFVVTDAQTEFAGGTDASNPRGAKREPFPRT